MSMEKIRKEGLICHLVVRPQHVLVACLLLFLQHLPTLVWVLNNREHLLNLQILAVQDGCENGLVD